MRNTLAALFAILLTAGTAIAADAASPDSTKTVAEEGGPCSDEGTLSDLLARKPLICTDGHWRKVVFKDAGDGTIKPLFYEGRCAFRFTEGQPSRGRVIVALKAGDIADICLPVGWKAHVVAASNTMDWLIHDPSAMPNVLLVKGARPSARTMLWIYPVTPDGRVPEKVALELLTRK